VRRSTAPGEEAPLEIHCRPQHGTRQGNAKAFEYYHRRVRKMQNGLAYTS
jgi:hypothetical protein